MSLNNMHTYLLHIISDFEFFFRPDVAGKVVESLTLNYQGSSIKGAVRVIREYTERPGVKRL